MRLAEAEAELSGKPQACKFQRLYDSLEEADQATLDGWVAAGKPRGWIAGVLQRAGHEISRDSVRVHLDRTDCYRIVVASEGVPLP